MKILPLICKQAIPFKPGEVPTEIQILPRGPFVYSKAGRTEVVNIDDAAIALIMSAFSAQENDLVIDYEHQTFAQPPIEAKAGGWIKELIDKGADGLWAAVEWTARAAEQIAAKEYRYFSPTLIPHRVTSKGDVFPYALGPGALTNYPLIDGMTPLTNKAETDPENNLNQGEEIMWEKVKAFLLSVLGLNAEATDDEILAAVSKGGAITAKGETLGGLIAKVETLKARPAGPEVLKALGLSETATEVEITGAILAMKAQVPDKSELEKLRADLNTIKAKDLVERAKSAGKLAPNMLDWANAMAMKSPTEFESWEKIAPVICKAGGLEPPADKGPKEVGQVADAYKQALLGSSGLTPDEQKKRGLI